MKLTIKTDKGDKKIEVNELSRNARGGTELSLERLHTFVDPELLSKFQIIPSRVREIDPDRKPILWLHDLPNDPESKHLADPESRKRFAGIVAVSNWQAQLYNIVLGVPLGDMRVIQNGIVPIEPHTKPTGPVRIIYHTTPHRGLQILVPVFEKLCETFDNIELDIFSSFSIYGWNERDEPYLPLFERAKANPKIRYHGAVSNEEVREALKHAHIFAYPSIWPETSCISAIEALSAGCQVVCPNYAALPETCANWAWTYPFHEDMQTHAGIFASHLASAIQLATQNDAGYVQNLSIQKDYFDHFYDWKRRGKEWEQYLRGLL